MRRVGRGRERGSIAVELVASIPILVAVAMILAQALALVAGVSSVNRAARDAARAAADANSSVSAQQAAERALPSFVEIRSVQVSEGSRSTQATVDVRMKYGINGILTAGGVDVSRSAEMPRIDSWG